MGSFESYLDNYNSLGSMIKEKEAVYNHNSDFIDEAIDNLHNEDEEHDHNIAPNTEHRDQIDRGKKKRTGN